jgi:hypothetical protein
MQKNLSSSLEGEIFVLIDDARLLKQAHNFSIDPAVSPQSHYQIISSRCAI